MIFRCLSENSTDPLFRKKTKGTHRFAVKVKHGGAKILLAFGKDLVGGRTGVRRRRVIKRRQFTNKIIPVINLISSHLREATSS